MRYFVVTKNLFFRPEKAGYLPWKQTIKSDSDHVMKKNNIISHHHLPFCFPRG
ncbi:hypothetical protein UYSO10_3778 [Kosakonia radicincitans]|nr:hypothetical protein UYSO10_3778 [Kosakonia radicincitans]